ncbi:DUF4198 domain-containing protein [Desulfothermus naphthae]
MNKTKMLVITSFMLLVGFVSAPVYAHYLWLTVDNYNPSPGQEIAINIGWGHKFPVDDQPRRKMVEKMKLVLVNPEGNKIPLRIRPKVNSGVEPIRVKLKDKGTYVVVLAVRTFVSKTIEGYFYKPKNELRNVLKSFWYEPVAKAIINVGTPEGNTYKKWLGYSLEILPLENPANLKEGEMLPVYCLLKGKPTKAWIYATYAGFSNLRNTFAWTTQTDKDMIAKVKILKKGIWLVKTEELLPYKDPRKADNYKFISTLTFEIK